MIEGLAAIYLTLRICLLTPRPGRTPVKLSMPMCKAAMTKWPLSGDLFRAS